MHTSTLSRRPNPKNRPDVFVLVLLAVYNEKRSETTGAPAFRFDSWFSSLTSAYVPLQPWWRTWPSSDRVCAPKPLSRDSFSGSSRGLR